ncbi:MAG: 2-oxoacid:acceptor oxidoreductase subunit alpha, partial [Candidatus Helarchaeota archaeon]
FYLQEGKTVKELFILGDHACALGAIHAGCNFFAGYPITPATEIAEYLSLHLPKNGGYFVQFEDELASMSAVIGASWAGAKAMTATSGPGFSLMQEALSYAYFTETPCVIVDVQRSGPSTGQATYPSQQDFYQARYGAHGDYEAIVLSPWSVQEAFDFTIKAFNLAEKYRTPVILLMDGAIGHSRERLIIPNKEKIEISKRILARNNIPFQAADVSLVPPMPLFGRNFPFMVTGSAHEPSGKRNYDPDIHVQNVARISAKILNNSSEIIELETSNIESAEYLICSFGVSARPSRGVFEKLLKENHKIGFIRFKTLWPFPDKQLRDIFNENIKKIFVVEMNIGKLVREIERVANSIPTYSFHKIGGIVPSINEIYSFIKNYLFDN